MKTMKKYKELNNFIALKSPLCKRTLWFFNQNIPITITVSGLSDTLSISISYVMQNDLGVKLLVLILLPYPYF